MVVAYLLWFFIGTFGAHRFYMKKTGSAVAQLILTITIIGAIVSGIWVLIDAFLASQLGKRTKPKDRRTNHQRPALPKALQ